MSLIPANLIINCHASVVGQSMCSPGIRTHYLPFATMGWCLHFFNWGTNAIEHLELGNPAIDTQPSLYWSALCPTRRNRPCIRVDFPSDVILARQVYPTGLRLPHHFLCGLLLATSCGPGLRFFDCLASQLESLIRTTTTTIVNLHQAR